MARVVRVPLKQLTSESAEAFGRVSRSLDEMEPIVREGEMVKERMEVRRQGNELYFKNHAVDDEGVVAELVGGTARVTYVNYHGDAHGDATQAFISASRRPTIFLVTKPTKNPRPEGFVAFYSDGSFASACIPRSGTRLHSPSREVKSTRTLRATNTTTPP